MRVGAWASTNSETGDREVYIEYTTVYTPREAYRRVYHRIYTQGGYQEGIPPYIHPERLPGRVNHWLYTPREVTREG